MRFDVDSEYMLDWSDREIFVGQQSYNKESCIMLFSQWKVQVIAQEVALT